MKIQGRLGPASTALGGAALGGAVLALAACGSAGPPSTGHPATPGASRATASAAAARASARVPLCAETSHPNRLEVRLLASQPREILPRALTSTDAARVGALARALCALPPLPPGRSCPAAPRGALLLVFATSGRGFSTVRIQDAGCPHVSGLGPAREWSWSSRPGQLLRQTVGGTGRLVPGTHPSSVPRP
jgi:hypothetical protein